MWQADHFKSAWAIRNFGAALLKAVQAASINRVTPREHSKIETFLDTCDGLEFGTNKSEEPMVMSEAVKDYPKLKRNMNFLLMHWSELIDATATKNGEEKQTTKAGAKRERAEDNNSVTATKKAGDIPRPMQNLKRQFLR